jgi:hypothetical protein
MWNLERTRKDGGKSAWLVFWIDLFSLMIVIIAIVWRDFWMISENYGRVFNMICIICLLGRGLPAPIGATWATWRPSNVLDPFPIRHFYFMLKINTNTDPNRNHGSFRQVDELLARASGALQLQTERVEPTCCAAAQLATSQPQVSFCREESWQKHGICS